MCFTTSAFEPGVQGVVDDETMFQLFMVVGEDLRQPERDCKQASTLWCEVESSDVRSSNLGRQIKQTRIRQFVLRKNRIEAAKRAVVSPFDSGHIMRNRAGGSCLSVNLILRDEHELCIRFDESGNQPRAADSIDFWTFSGKHARECYHICWTAKISGRHCITFWIPNKKPDSSEKPGFVR